MHWDRLADSRADWTAGRRSASRRPIIEDDDQELDQGEARPGLAAVLGISLPRGDDHRSDPREDGWFQSSTTNGSSTLAGPGGR